MYYKDHNRLIISTIYYFVTFHRMLIMYTMVHGSRLLIITLSYTIQSKLCLSLLRGDYILQTWKYGSIKIIAFNSLA